MTDQLLTRGSLVLVIGFLFAGVIMFGVAVHAYFRRALIRDRERRAQAERNAKRLADMIRAEREQSEGNVRYMAPELVRKKLGLNREPGPYTTHSPISKDNCPGYDSDDCTEQCHDFWQCEGKGRAS